MSEVIEANHADNEWYRDRNKVANARQGVELRFWPHAGHWRQGATARLALKWVTVGDSSRNPIVVPDACLLLSLDEMRALRDKAVEVVRLMEDHMIDDEEDSE